MTTNFANGDGLINQMPNFYQEHSSGIDDSYPNSHETHGHITHDPSNFQPVFQHQPQQHGLTNSFGLPLYSGQQFEHRAPFDGHRHSHNQQESFAYHTTFRQAPRYPELQNPYSGDHFMNSARYSMPGHSLQPLGHRFENVHLTNSISNFGMSSDMHTAPLAMPQHPPVIRYSSGEPYAKLIYEALRMEPDHQMVLKDIYKWFEENTDKPQTSNGNGWKNSIRHNLSMNAAFQKTEARNETDDGKKSYIWALSARALASNGVQSTTRYRKNVPKKSSSNQSQHRISKNIHHNPSINPSLAERFHVFKHKQDHEDNGLMNVKQERRSQDLTALPQTVSPNWSVQDYSMPPQMAYQPTLSPWSAYNLQHNDNIGYSTSARLPSLASLAPPTPVQHHTYGHTQQNTPEGNRPRNSPTPSMTTAQSSFGYHEDIEFDHHPQAVGYYDTTDYKNDQQPNQTFPAIYQDDEVSAVMDRL